MRAGKGFRTLEWYQDLEGKLTGEDAPSMENACVLLECISNLTANEMYMEGGAGERTVEAVVRGVGLLKKKCRHLVVVTNEIFSDGIQYSPDTRQYQAYLGQINQEIARVAVNVTEVVYGIPLCHKNERKEGQKI